MNDSSRALEHLLLPLLFVSGLWLFGAVQAVCEVPNFPFPQERRYAEGTIRPNHRSQQALNEDIRAAYERWKTSFLVQAGATGDGHPRYRVLVAEDPSRETISEGQGYGMMIVAYLAGHEANAQQIFDGLWEYFDDHRSTIDPRLMDWFVRADESVDDQGDFSAFDGDADIAYALLLAHRQWGSGGRIAYQAKALDVLAGLLASEVGPTSHLPMLGDWVPTYGSDCNSIGLACDEWTPRSSDFMAASFRSFARATGEHEWDNVLEAVQETTEILQNSASPETGLLPDFVVPTSSSDVTPRPSPPFFLEGAQDGDYFYNAGRVPWRLAMDALFHGDPTSWTQALRISRWAESIAQGDPSKISPGYHLDGTPIPPADYWTSFFAAPMGVAAMLDPEQQSWLNALYDQVRDSQEGYYEDTVTLLSLLLMTGNAWDPSETPPSQEGCVADSHTLCLNEERFRVQVAWQDFENRTGVATVVPHGTDDSGILWFFNSSNWEMLIKVLDGCQVNGNFWVFAAATTNVAYTLTVTDTERNSQAVYTNPLGTSAPALTDTSAFSTCP